ncbi:threonylcarbamoyladenosine tRNA methylthiotransferase [Iris pallida]|uniref:Threonylcarbamoyladenosine tRNA methylthiotransferase n=1 Tax=Iris pallida TaxID=29817 RepID=A0AAX6GIR9_IRIPA|nr:threonylcarbamoyladenosine tRNA methylthiotransferase [Iris pallida]KAJ6844024.1 threonylcarbamoyladenosine tRNA methylthiotransferase [Iris pallida]
MSPPAMASLTFASAPITGHNIGSNLPLLLNAIVAELPSDRSTMLLIGMTNPPFILEYLQDIAEVLRHPSVYSFLHVIVQSGSDSVLDTLHDECWHCIRQ